MSAGEGRLRRPEIVIQNAGSYPELAAVELRGWLQSLVASLAPGHESLGVRFNGERAMSELNRRFRGRRGATDVLSFPGENGHLGDVAICVARARSQAAERGHALEREIRLLLLHGVLHCLGYDHESDDGEMAALERRLRRRWLDPR